MLCCSLQTSTSNPYSRGTSQQTAPEQGQICMWGHVVHPTSGAKKTENVRFRVPIHFATNLWFLVCYAATQLATLLHQKHIPVVHSNKVARKRMTESNSTPAMDLGHMNVGWSECICLLEVWRRRDFVWKWSICMLKLNVRIVIICGSIII